MFRPGINTIRSDLVIMEDKPLLTIEQVIEGHYILQEVEKEFELELVRTDATIRMAHNLKKVANSNLCFGGKVTEVYGTMIQLEEYVWTDNADELILHVLLGLSSEDSYYRLVKNPEAEKPVTTLGTLLKEEVIETPA